MEIIAVRELSKTFGKVVALDKLSFDVRAGELFALLGPNGAGKTTTLRILTTLLAPSSGSVQLDGLDPTRERREVRKRLGVVFQDPSLDQELSAVENLELHAALYGVAEQARVERSETLLKSFDLWDRRNDPVRTFSGGMKRRLEVVRALL